MITNYFIYLRTQLRDYYLRLIHLQVIYFDYFFTNTHHPGPQDPYRFTPFSSVLQFLISNTCINYQLFNLHDSLLQQFLILKKDFSYSSEFLSVLFITSIFTMIQVIFAFYFGDFFSTEPIFRFFSGLCYFFLI